MSKGNGIGGCLHGILTVALAAAVGYNAWQTMRLKAEIDALKNSAASKSGGGPQALPMLQQARRHALRGERLLKENKLAEAQAEFALAAAQARGASGASGVGYVSKGEIETFVATWSKKAGALWDQKKEGNLR